MKDALELLAKLRAAGVEPMDDSYYTESAEACVRLHMQYHDAHTRERDRMIADLLEARAKLAEVRASLESDLRQGLPTSAAELLEILDKEPEP